MAPTVLAGVGLEASWDFGREGGARRDFHVTVPRLGVIVTVLGLVRTHRRFLVSLAASLTRRAPKAAAHVVQSLCARAAVPTHPSCSHRLALAAQRCLAVPPRAATNLDDQRVLAAAARA